MSKEIVETTAPPPRKRKRRTAICSKSRKVPKVLPEIVLRSTECCFCHCGVKQKSVGNWFQDDKSNLAAHQFCLFFSAGLPQNGNDEEGFDGFLLKDVLKEAQRAHTINCKICHQSGASSGCSVRSCRAFYHYTCGKARGIQFCFSGAFDSYCKTHRTYQDLRRIKRVKVPYKCPVCLEEIIQSDHRLIVKTPCCKNVFIHKECVQEQANHSGYFFRCPTCNDTDNFKNVMVEYGIFAPQRDAAWEENNAYSDLLEQYSKCDISNCRCDKGRHYNTKTGRWHILLCYVCGQSGVHLKCLGRRYIPSIGYVCVDCNSVVSLSKEVINVQTHEAVQYRLQEHKRRLKELTARKDPVLLASPVFAAPLWREKFNIRPSFVVIKKINPELLPLQMLKTVKTRNTRARNRIGGTSTYTRW